MSITRQAPFQLERLGEVMEPEPGNPAEAWGVLNPGCARGPDGVLYLYPRLVAEGNYSRIGIARVEFAENGDPIGVDRLGYALEPKKPYERSKRGVSGVEDPRVTFVEPLGVWIMAYTAVSVRGSRIALAFSHDLWKWERLGVLVYEVTSGVDFNLYDNKDGMMFPDVVLDPTGEPALAILHRPRYLHHHVDGTIHQSIPDGVKEERESMWISYISLSDAQRDLTTLVRVYDEELLATPEQPWEELKIGGGTPPLRIPQGWLIFYHGASGRASLDPEVPKEVRYSAGVMILDKDRPTKILYRSPKPVLEPGEQHEREGIVPNVVFPTGIDTRADGRIDVYYGMADLRIGAAETHVPEEADLESETSIDSASHRS